MTNWGGAIEPWIPDKYCVENWKQLNYANGKTGMGIESSRATQGALEGSEGYIRTRYSSTGFFNMEFGGFVKYDGFFNGCNGCYAKKVSYWAGFDDQVRSPAQVYAP